MSKPLFLTETADAPLPSRGPHQRVGRKWAGPLSDVHRKTLASGYSEDEEQVFKSLQLAHDFRYDTMDYYRTHGGTASNDGHFARIVQTNRRMHGMNEKMKTVGQESDFCDIAIREIEEPVNSWDQRYTPSASVSDRVAWQESFDREVKKLFVDFELTDSPHCRLNHLDRMHEWFTTHGQKQARKAKKGPNYLIADRGGVMPAGSTKNIPSTLSSTSQVLRTAFEPPFQASVRTPR
mmetsp:Transcript_23190/g.66892  ORF Transcript_23190/g.66892 Transcript_23190/m.66892 type:complete len:236 (+) Transcript_23190:161-868(+)